MDPITMMALGGGIIGGLGSLFGARSQASADRANTAAEQQRFQQLMALINSQMSKGTNPFAKQIMNFANNAQAPVAQNAPVVGTSQIDLTKLGSVTPGTVTAPTLGDTPLAGLPGLGEFDTYAGAKLGATPTIGAPSTFNAPQIDLSAFGLPSQVTAPGMGGVGSVNANQIDFSSFGTPGFNTGQDALMQMLTRQVGGGPTDSLTANLQRFVGGGTDFNASPLLGSMDRANALALDDQVSQLRGSAGSLGERLGSSMFDAEARLRANFGAQTSLQREQLLQGSYEQAQARAAQALGLSTGREQFFAGMPLQNAGMQLNAAQALANSGLGASEIQARLAQSNQGAALQAGMFNVGNQMNMGQFGASQAMQAALANQGAGQNYQQMLAGLAQSNQQAGLQAGLQNQQLGTQVNMQNVANLLSNQQLGAQFQQQAGLAGMDAGLRAALQAQQLGSQISMQNANNQLSNMQFGAGQQMQAGLANQQAMLQAMLQGQNLNFQGMSQNANALNNMGQFNAQNLMQQNMFNSQMGQNYNQFMLGAMGQAGGLQGQQQGLNAQLLGILGGVGVPQQQPNPWPQAMGDIGMMAMLPWMMR